MAEITADTQEKINLYGFAGTAVYPHSQAGKGTLKGVVINDDANSPEPTGGVSGPGAGTELTKEELAYKGPTT
jgi:hypothetical protein